MERKLRIYAALRREHLPNWVVGKPKGRQQQVEWRIKPCSWCGFDVWYHPDHVEDRTVVCWECLGATVERCAE